MGKFLGLLLAAPAKVVVYVIFGLLFSGEWPSTIAGVLIVVACVLAVAAFARWYVRRKAELLEIDRPLE